MLSTPIQLPGLGQPSTLFAFDATSDASSRLMNLEALNESPIAEHWFAPGPTESSNANPFTTTTSPHYQLRTLIVEAPPTEMRQIAQAAYRTLLTDIAGSTHSQLTRFWNYVPQINVGAGDNEVYRQFCWGRAEAFEAHQFDLPAATAIGSKDGLMRISALTTTQDTLIEHVENPRQLSAYKYPKQYGPRSPSFARATWVERNNNGLLLLSGTASIVEHKTLHSGNLGAQVAETKRNIDHLIQNFTSRPAHTNRQLTPLAIRFYLRDAKAQNAARQAYQQAFTGYPEAEFFVADICRHDLGMEIEGVFADSSAARASA